MNLFVHANKDFNLIMKHTEFLPINNCEPPFKGNIIDVGTIQFILK